MVFFSFRGKVGRGMFAEYFPVAMIMWRDFLLYFLLFLFNVLFCDVDCSKLGLF